LTIVVCESVQVLQVYLVNDARLRWDHLEVAEGVLAPTEEFVALAVSFVFELGVGRERPGVTVVVHLDRVVDDQLTRDERIDLVRVAPQIGHRVAHRGQVNDGRHPGKVLEEHAGRAEPDLDVRLGLRVPLAQGLDVGSPDGQAVLGAEQVFEQDLEGERQSVRLGEVAVEGGETVDGVGLAVHVQSRASPERVRHG
jgi:hypothetical protein